MKQSHPTSARSDRTAAPRPAASAVPATPDNTPITPDNLTIIGNSVRISVAGIRGVPAKVDTGATVSSIWASQIRLTADSKLQFCLFAKGHELYTGEVLTAEKFKVRKVRNSTGQETIRYMVVLPTSIRGRRIRISYTLADRSRNDFPVLIGRRALLGKFLVDVSRLGVPYKERAVQESLNAELKKDPRKFHQKYMKSQPSSAKAPKSKH